MLYVGCNEPLRERSDVDLRIEPVEPGRQAVVQWFFLPSVQFVGAHTQCSCGFPHVIAETPIEYWEGMWSESEEREADIRSMRALIELLRDVIKPGESIELYPVWDGNEGDPPKGRVVWSIGRTAADTSVFTEQFLYEVRANSV
jgi:hypothetical protein